MKVLHQFTYITHFAASNELLKSTSKFYAVYILFSAFTDFILAKLVLPISRRINKRICLIICLITLPPWLKVVMFYLMILVT